MRPTDIVGWTADADVYCMECARKLYPAHCSCCGTSGQLFDPGWHTWRECVDALVKAGKQARWPDPPGYFTATDREGNEVYPIFRDTEWDSPQHCAQCHVMLRVRLTSDGEEYVRQALTDWAGDPDVLIEWEDEYGYVMEDKDAIL